MKVYLRGLLGILLGTLIACFPWTLFDTLGNTFLPILTILLPIGGYTGYRISKVKIKGASLMILIISSLLLALFCFLLFPFFTLFKDHFPITFSNLWLYYDDHDFLIEVIRNFLFSGVFTMVGVGAVILLLKEDDLEEIGR